MSVFYRNGKTYGISDYSANNVTYDNSESGLEAVNTQDAIDKVKEKITDTFGTAQFRVQDGEIQWKAEGADTWNPFRANTLVGMDIEMVEFIPVTTSEVTSTFTCTEEGYYLLVGVSAEASNTTTKYVNHTTTGKEIMHWQKWIATNGTDVYDVLTTSEACYNITVFYLKPDETITTTQRNGTSATGHVMFYKITLPSAFRMSEAVEEEYINIINLESLELVETKYTTAGGSTSTQYATIDYTVPEDGVIVVALRSFTNSYEEYLKINNELCESKSYVKSSTTSCYYTQYIENVKAGDVISISSKAVGTSSKCSINLSMYRELNNEKQVLFSTTKTLVDGATTDGITLTNTIEIPNCGNAMCTVSVNYCNRNSGSSSVTFNNEVIEPVIITEDSIVRMAVYSFPITQSGTLVINASSTSYNSAYGAYSVIVS